MKTEQSIEQVFEGLAAIKKNLDQQMRFLDEEIRRAQLEYLENSFEEQKDALADCIKGIDQQLMELSVYVDEYRRLLASLTNLNEKIPGVGGALRVMPEGIGNDSLEAILTARIDHLKSQAKI